MRVRPPARATVTVVSTAMARPATGLDVELARPSLARRGGDGTIRGTVRRRLCVVLRAARLGNRAPRAAGGGRRPDRARSVLSGRSSLTWRSGRRDPAECRCQAGRRSRCAVIVLSIQRHARTSGRMIRERRTHRARGVPETVRTGQALYVERIAVIVSPSEAVDEAVNDGEVSRLEGVDPRLLPPDTPRRALAQAGA